MRDLAKALPLALSELESAQERRDFLAARAPSLQISLTAGVSGSLPVSFLLTGAERDAVLALLPALTEHRVAEAAAKVRQLAEGIAQAVAPVT